MTDLVNIETSRNETPKQSTDLTVVVLAVAFIVVTGLGMFLGNVFETYHNGSSL